MARTSSAVREVTRRNLKRVARRLFAERGVDGVSVREIVEASGQRNAAALHYHFGTKDDLVRELLLDGAKLIDDSRQAILDELEAAGGPRSVRDVVAALVTPNLTMRGEAGEEETYLRFIVALQAHHRELFRELLEERWGHGYQRGLTHLRRLLDQLPAELVNQRLVFMGMAMQAWLAAREAAVDHSGPGKHRFWDAGSTTDSMIDSLTGLLEAEPTAALAAQFPHKG